MTKLREQLDTLLILEVKYATRDYLLDLTWPRDNCGDSVASNDENATPHTSFDEEILQEFDNHCNEEKSNDAPSASRIKSAIANNVPMTEQHAIEWREKMCKWLYQGEKKERNTKYSVPCVFPFFWMFHVACS